MAFDGHARARSSSRDDPSNYNQDDYERGRQRIDLKLKGTFERIFEKYARDFSGVGDEIDLETGELVIDNGHLTYMQHERDTGKSASSRFVRAFADELEVEDGDGEDAVDEEEEDDDDDDELSDEDSQEEDQSMSTRVKTRMLETRLATSNLATSRMIWAANRRISCWILDWLSPTQALAKSSSTTIHPSFHPPKLLSPCCLKSPLPIL
jgi:hypothetical protein